jgi:trehalose-phosphatase
MRAPELLRRLSGTPRVILLDIDGTLAPIAPRPEMAVVDPDMLDAIDRLTRAEQTVVGVVSGRAVADGRRLVPVAGTWTIGNHGIETMDPSGDVVVHEAARTYEQPIARALTRMTDIAGGIDGVVIENKRWTLSIHFRVAPPEAGPLIDAAAVDISHTLGLVVTRGKGVVEIRPPTVVNKGTASVALIRRLDAATSAASIAYLGDDETDEDAFRQLRAEWPHAVAVRVGGPITRASAAEFTLADHHAVRDLLTAMG